MGRKRRRRKFVDGSCSFHFVLVVFLFILIIVRDEFLVGADESSFLPPFPCFFLFVLLVLEQLPLNHQNGRSVKEVVSEF